MWDFQALLLRPRLQACLLWVLDEVVKMKEPAYSLREIVAADSALSLGSRSQMSDWH